MGRTFITVKDSFSALHCWPECPFEEVSFLKNLHRHLFKVKITIETFEDRQQEFLMVKRKLQKFIDKKYRNKDLDEKSCEVIAKEISDFMKAIKVEVEEDGENGAIYVAN